MKFTVWTTSGWIGPGTRRTYYPARTVYPMVKEPQDARVFYRKQDAERALGAMSPHIERGEVVPCKMWFGPYPVPSAPMEQE